MNIVNDKIVKQRHTIERYKKEIATLRRVINNLLDEAISYGEYVMTKEDMEALADATGYELPDNAWGA